MAKCTCEIRKGGWDFEVDGKKTSDPKLVKITEGVLNEYSRLQVQHKKGDGNKFLILCVIERSDELNKIFLGDLSTNYGKKVTGWGFKMPLKIIHSDCPKHGDMKKEAR